MLEIVNRLSVFFEDCYREVSVREYAREMGISPPTASKFLNGFVDEGFLERREERGFLLFRVDGESSVLRNLGRIYWGERLAKLIMFLRDEVGFGSIVLFGSLDKLEVTGKSDIDLAVFGGSKKRVNLEKFEKKLGREIQLFRFVNLGEVDEELRLNIVNGCVMEGYLE